MPQTLLLADDSVTIQKVVGITFANEDVELVTVDNGADALARAKDLKPDMIMADVAMPGLGGYELCAAIRRDPELSHIPVLLLTGTFEAYDEQKALAVGASGHVAKPFEAQALIKGRAGIMAKIEKPAALGRIEDIVALVDAVGVMIVAAVLTVWSMAYYLRKAIPEIRAKAR